MTVDAAKALLEARDISVSYSGTVAVDNVSFTINAGEAVALAGQNGAGKSSLLKAVAGLQDMSGSVFSDGNIAYVSQRSHARWQFPITVFDVVLSGRHQFRKPLRRWAHSDRVAAQSALQRLNAEDLAPRPIGALSGGQAQRVLLARALAQEPELLLLDEPFTGLDRRASDIFAELIATLAHEGLGVLCALHDLGLARRVFDRVIGINQHKVFDGSPQEVLNEHNIDELFSARDK